LKNSEKISEIWGNSAETQWRRRRNSQILESRNLVGFAELSGDFTDKSVIFSEIHLGDSHTNFGRNQSNFAENWSMERKNRGK
jgi:hypothetical protein